MNFARRRSTRTSELGLLGNDELLLPQQQAETRARPNRPFPISYLLLGCALIVCLCVATVILPWRFEVRPSLPLRDLEATEEIGHKHRMLVHFNDDAMTAMELLPDALRPSTQATVLGMSNMQVLEFESPEAYQQAVPYMTHKSLNFAVRDFPMARIRPRISEDPHMRRRLDGTGSSTLAVGDGLDSIIASSEDQNASNINQNASNTTNSQRQDRQNSSHQDEQTQSTELSSPPPYDLPPSLLDSLGVTTLDDIKQVTPDDPLYTKQWHLPWIGADYAWSVTRGAAEVVVAIVDSGADLRHPDLRNSLWVNHGEIPDNGIDDDGNGFIDDVHGYDFAGSCAPPTPGNPFQTGCWSCVGDPDPQDDSDDSHGTHVAGIIAAMQDNLLGVSGAAPSVKIMILKVTDCNGQLWASTIAAAYEYAAKMGAHVVSASIGPQSYNYGFKPLTKAPSMYAGWTAANTKALQPLTDRNILLVSAAGNENMDMDVLLEMGYDYSPCLVQLPNVMCVAASAVDDRMEPFSNFGVKGVHIAAPGENILSTVIGSNYTWLSGTSMAAPIVSAAAALLTSVLGMRDGNFYQGVRVKEMLMATAEVVTPQLPVACGARLNMEAAVALALRVGVSEGLLAASPLDPSLVVSAPVIVEGFSQLFYDTSSLLPPDTQQEQQQQQVTTNSSTSDSGTTSRNTQQQQQASSTSSSSSSSDTQQKQKQQQASSGSSGSSSSSGMQQQQQAATALRANTRHLLSTTATHATPHKRLAPGASSALPSSSAGLMGGVRARTAARLAGLAVGQDNARELSELLRQELADHVPGEDPDSALKGTGGGWAGGSSAGGGGAGGAAAQRRLAAVAAAALEALRPAWVLAMVLQSGTKALPQVAASLAPAGPNSFTHFKVPGEHILCNSSALVPLTQRGIHTLAVRTAAKQGSFNLLVNGVLLQLSTTREASFVVLDPGLYRVELLTLGSVVSRFELVLCQPGSPLFLSLPAPLAIVPAWQSQINATSQSTTPNSSGSGNGSGSGSGNSSGSGSADVRTGSSSTSDSTSSSTSITSDGGSGSSGHGGSSPPSSTSGSDGGSTSGSDGGSWRGQSGDRNGSAKVSQGQHQASASSQSSSQSDSQQALQEGLYRVEYSPWGGKGAEAWPGWHPAARSLMMDTLACWPGAFLSHLFPNRHHRRDPKHMVPEQEHGGIGDEAWKFATGAVGKISLHINVPEASAGDTVATSVVFKLSCRNCSLLVGDLLLLDNWESAASAVGLTKMSGCVKLRPGSKQALVISFASKDLLAAPMALQWAFGCEMLKPNGDRAASLTRHNDLHFIDIGTLEKSTL